MLPNCASELNATVDDTFGVPIVISNSVSTTSDQSLSEHFRGIKLRFAGDRRCTGLQTSRDPGGMVRDRDGAKSSSRIRGEHRWPIFNPYRAFDIESVSRQVGQSGQSEKSVLSVSSWASDHEQCAKRTTPDALFARIPILRRSRRRVLGFLQRSNPHTPRTKARGGPPIERRRQADRRGLY